MAKKRKYYVVWKGIKTGVFDTWAECNKQISGFTQAQYKSFLSKKEAENAFEGSYWNYVGKNTKKTEVSFSEKKKVGNPIMQSISVDAACNTKTGDMEYKGVFTKTGQEIFIQGPFFDSTNNIGEFLALVHGLAWLKKQNNKLPIYSDSKVAIKWVKDKHAKTNQENTYRNKKIFEMIKRAEDWLKNNEYNTKILKWETRIWGEIPADFGRK